MATRQYIGARYVPKFYQNSVDGSTQWQSNVVYEPLMYVTLTNGHMYISKKQVPATVGTPAENVDYWLDIGSYNGFIEDLQGQIDTINTNITSINDDLGVIDANCVSTENFDTINDAIEYAHTHNVNKIVLSKNTTITKPIVLYDNMIFDGNGHKIDCSSGFVGNRVFTNDGSGYWNNDNTVYAAYVTNLHTNHNITIKNVILGEFHRTNAKFDGTDIGANCKPRNWFAFDNMIGLTIDNIKSTTTNVESYVWTTQSKDIKISNCEFDAEAPSGGAGCIWIYTRFDNSSDAVGGTKNVTIDNCKLICTADEAIAIRSYDTAVFENILINNCYFNGGNGQGVILDSNTSYTPKNIKIENSTFFNCGIRGVNRIKDVSVINCDFSSDLNNVSNQSYYIRNMDASGFTGSPSKWLISKCHFDKHTNYNTVIWFDKIHSVTVDSCLFDSDVANTSGPTCIAYGNLDSAVITNNVFTNCKYCIEAYVASNDINQSINIGNNVAFNCVALVEVAARMRYANIHDNSLSVVTYLIYYHGADFKDCKISGNYGESVAKLFSFESGTAINGMSLISDNVVVTDGASASKFFADTISASSKMKFSNNYYKTFSISSSLTLYPNS